MFSFGIIRVFLFSFAFFLCQVPVSAREVIITGCFPLAAGEEVRLIQYKDFLSQVETVADVCRIDADGNFSLGMQCAAPQPVWVDVAFYRDRLFVLPGGKYHLHAETFSVRENGNPLLPRSVIGASISSLTPQVRDSLLSGLEREIQGFLDTFSVQVYINRQEHLLDSFATRSYRKYLSAGDAYTARAAACRLASLYPYARLPYGIESLSAMTADTNNYYYIEWLDDYLEKRLLKEARGKPSGLRSSLIATVNKSGSYLRLQDTLARYLQISDSLYIGFLTLTAIKTMYPAPLFPTSQLLLFLRQIDSGNNHEPYRTIAKRLLDRYTAISRGSKLSEAVFTEISGDTLRFSQFRGKPLYIVFARPGCMSCLAGLESLRLLKERFGDRVHFLAMFTSHDTARAAQFVRTAAYPWPVAIIGRDYKLMYQLKAFGLPLEMLIGADGNILAYPAYRPEEGLEAVLLKLTGNKPLNMPRFNPARRRN